MSTKQKSKAVKKPLRTYQFMVAPDRRLFYLRDKRGDFAFQVLAANHKITCHGEGYRNMADRSKEIARLWPHTQIVQPDQTSINDR